MLCQSRAYRNILYFISNSPASAHNSLWIPLGFSPPISGTHPSKLKLSNSLISGCRFRRRAAGKKLSPALKKTSEYRLDVARLERLWDRVNSTRLVQCGKEGTEGSWQSDSSPDPGCTRGHGGDLRFAKAVELRPALKFGPGSVFPRSGAQRTGRYNGEE